MTKLRDAVVVITGASSGIGRASALTFARRGAAVVLGARREQSLEQLAAECEELGGRAIAVRTDVTSEPEVQNLAERAVDSFGRLDVWVNNAGVSLFARFEDAPLEAFRRVIETNFFGYVHGARAALKLFREQDSGVLINNASILARVGSPYVSAYSAAKFAVRGLSESLRQELRDASDIHVCTVMPASIDTPLFQHAANYTRRAVKPLRPIYEVEKVARAIVRCAKRPRREVVVGRAGRMQMLTRRLSPAAAELTMARQVEKDHFQDSPARTSAGNLFEPVVGWESASGGWKTNGRLKGAAVGAVGVAGLAAWMRLRQPGPR